MAVNLTLPAESEIRPIAGVELGIAEANIRTPDRKDLLVIKLPFTATVAGVFTKNRFSAAPVQISKAHLESVQKTKLPIRALVINTGNANAGTGDQGLIDANETCAVLADLLECAPSQILPFSTGVILEPLPMDRLLSGLPTAVSDLKEHNWMAAAEAILTTDTLSKISSRTVPVGDKQVRITGISKGAGMIKPNMATMLGFIAIDAHVPQPALEHLAKVAADQSFNCITVDGDTSTNDSFILMASGMSNLRISSEESVETEEYAILSQAVIEVAQELAQMIVRDGEGATKFITVQVEEGQNVEECRQIAFAIAQSPLVKTAFFASDPNLGRILAAIGYAGVEDLDISKLDLYLNDVKVASRGQRDPDYREKDGQQVMNESEITVRVTLGRGEESATVWTCDLSHDYVTINAEYRT